MSLRRIQIQSGCTDHMHRPIDGIFEVFIDEDEIIDQMERAYINESHKSKCGALIVKFKKASKAQADFLVKQEREKDAD